MKKLLIFLLAFIIMPCGFCATKSQCITKKEAIAQIKMVKKQEKMLKQQAKEQAKEQAEYQKKLSKELKNPKDKIKEAEYKAIKTQYFQADGYGEVYNCKVANERFCKVKNLENGIYVLCDYKTTRTQMESAKTMFELGKCTKLN